MSASEQRPIDAAMAAHSETKANIRKLWLDVIRSHKAKSHTTPLYVTLCGAAGIDVQLLIDNKIIGLEPSGAIRAKDVPLVVAFEKDLAGAIALKEKFPGLDVKQQNIHEQLKIQTFFHEPSKANRKIFAAPVVNLDYDTGVTYVDGTIPIAEACRRIALCHQTHESWSLLLTVNSTINWTIDQQSITRDLIKQILAGDDAPVRKFATDSDGYFLDSDVFLTNSDWELGQRFMALALPLFISDKLATDLWVVSSRTSILYPGGKGAPMVTWVLEVDYDEAAAAKRMENGKRLLEDIASTAIAIGRGETWVP